jgi:hypothetical protein
MNDVPSPDPVSRDEIRRLTALAPVLVPTLCVILVGVALGQIAFVVPAYVQAMQDFGMPGGTLVELLRRIPVWAAAVAGVIAILLAIRWRRSLRKSGALAAVLVLANVAILASIAQGYLQLRRELE